MKLIDTCGWIEWLTNGALAEQYEPYFNRVEEILVPTSIQFDLYKWVANNNNVTQALEAIAFTEQAKVIPLSTSIALLAGDLSIEHKLSFADSVIFGSATFHNVELITSDSHFCKLPRVVYFEKNA